MHLTQKQLQLLTVIAKGNGPGEPMDLDQILDACPYETTKQSIQFSIRSLIGKELIVKLGLHKRRGRQRQVIDATKAGRDIVGIPAEPSPTYVQAIVDPELDIPIGDIDEDLA